MPGLVFSCLAEERREILFVAEAVLLLRGVVEEDVPDFEGLVEGFLPLTDGLTAIAKDAECCKIAFGKAVDARSGVKYSFLEENIDMPRFLSWHVQAHCGKNPRMG